MSATDAVAQRAGTRLLSETGLLVATLVGFVIWQIGGAVDTWYHAHRGFEIESFFTLAHALLYAGWLSSTMPALIYLVEGRSSGATLLPGYPLLLVGSGLFGAAGMFDMLWHIAIGFEVGQEALVSPSHLALIYSSAVSVVGFVWAAVAHRRKAPGRLATVALVVSICVLLRTALFALLYIEPLSVDYASGGAIAGTLFGFAGITAWRDMSAQVAGTAGMIVYSVMLMLFVVVPLRVFRLGGGVIATSVIWCAVVRMMAMPEMWIYLPAVVASALVGEAVWAAIRRGTLGGPGGDAGYWVIAFAVPATQMYLYFATMAVAGGGIAWSTPLWAGAPVLAGAFAAFAAMLAIPPRFLRESD